VPEIVVFDPTVPAPQEDSDGARSLAARKSDLSGKTIGFLWNTKGNADVYLDEIAHLLGKKHPGIVPLMFEKKSASMAMEPEVYAALLECDAVVNAFGD
jgi:hypothetical protein